MVLFAYFGYVDVGGAERFVPAGSYLAEAHGMNADEFQRDEFLTLRDEIKSTKARLFWIVTIGLVGVPLLTYLGSRADLYVRMLLPYSVLVLIVLFLAEQSSMMRAGRYIRERIEKEGNRPAGWESWIESRSEFRLADRHFLACTLIVFFVYYFVTIGMAMDMLLREESRDMFGRIKYWYWFYGALATYAIGTIWVVLTLIHHWRSSVSTSDAPA